MCVSLKNIPPLLAMEKNTLASGFAANFSSDVIERNKQLIFVCCESLTGFTRLRLLKDQTAESLRLAVLSTTLDIISEEGCTVRTDNHRSFVSLQNEAKSKGSQLNQYNISIETGRQANKNKNSLVERTNREVHKEILKTFPGKNVLSKTDLCILERQINSRVKYHQHCARELFLRRDFINNAVKNTSDIDIARLQLSHRMEKSASKLGSQAKTMKVPGPSDFSVGDLVLRREDGSKLQPKQLLIITNISL